jgi:hypothetical protein
MAGITLGVILVALVILAIFTSEAEADRSYNDPTNDKQDQFFVDFSKYEQDTEIQSVTITIDVKGDDPREYRHVSDGDGYTPMDFYLTNPKPEEK